jgi:hypothetical protein
MSGTSGRFRRSREHWRKADPDFCTLHGILNRATWSSRAETGRLLIVLVNALPPDAPIVIGLDDTIERRWGAKISARGIYRDPVPSGLRWLC